MCNKIFIPPICYDEEIIRLSKKCSRLVPADLRDVGSYREIDSDPVPSTQKLNKNKKDD